MSPKDHHHTSHTDRKHISDSAEVWTLGDIDKNTEAIDTEVYTMGDSSPIEDPDPEWAKTLREDLRLSSSNVDGGHMLDIARLTAYLDKSLGDVPTNVDTLSNSLSQTKEGKALLKTFREKRIPLAEVAAGLTLSIGFHIGALETATSDTTLRSMADVLHLAYEHGILERRSAREFFALLRQYLEQDPHFFDTVNIGHLYIDYDHLVSATITQEEVTQAKQVFDILVSELELHRDDPMQLIELINGAMGRYHPDARDMTGLLIDIHNFDEDDVQADLVGNCEARAKIGHALIHSIRPDIEVLMRRSIIIDRITKKFTPHLDTLVQIDDSWYVLGSDNVSPAPEHELVGMFAPETLWYARMGMAEDSESLIASEDEVLPGTEEGGRNLAEAIRGFTPSDIEVSHDIERQGRSLVPMDYSDSVLIIEREGRDSIVAEEVLVQNEADAVFDARTVEGTAQIEQRIQELAIQALVVQDTDTSTLPFDQLLEHQPTPPGTHVDGVDPVVLAWRQDTDTHGNEIWYPIAGTRSELAQGGWSLQSIDGGAANEFIAMRETPEERGNRLQEYFDSRLNARYGMSSESFDDFINKNQLNESEYVHFLSQLMSALDNQHIVNFKISIPSYIRAYDDIASVLQDQSITTQLLIEPANLDWVTAGLSAFQELPSNVVFDIPAVAGQVMPEDLYIAVQTLDLYQIGQYDQDCFPLAHLRNGDRVPFFTHAIPQGVPSFAYRYPSLRYDADTNILTYIDNEPEHAVMQYEVQRTPFYVDKSEYRSRYFWTDTALDLYRYHVAQDMSYTIANNILPIHEIVSIRQSRENSVNNIRYVTLEVILNSVYAGAIDLPRDIDVLLHQLPNLRQVNIDLGMSDDLSVYPGLEEAIRILRERGVEVITSAG